MYLHMWRLMSKKWPNRKWPRLSRSEEGGCAVAEELQCVGVRLCAAPRPRSCQLICSAITESRSLCAPLRHAVQEENPPACVLVLWLLGRLPRRRQLFPMAGPPSRRSTPSSAAASRVVEGSQPPPRAAPSALSRRPGASSPSHDGLAPTSFRSRLPHSCRPPPPDATTRTRRPCRPPPPEPAATGPQLPPTRHGCAHGRDPTGKRKLCGTCACVRGRVQPRRGGEAPQPLAGCSRIPEGGTSRIR